MLFLSYAIPKLCIAKLKSEQKKQDTFKNWPLIKNPQFLSNLHETWWKWLSHEAIIFTKFHKDWTKIMDFLLMANFWTCPVFFAQNLPTLMLWWSFFSWIMLNCNITQKRGKKSQNGYFDAQATDKVFIEL